MERLSLTEFTRKIYLKAPPETVYRCWATEEGLCSWFLRSASFTDPSGRRRGPGEPESTLQIHYGCSNGWTFWLANLKAWLEHGIHLGERDFDLGNDPMAGFEFVNM